MPEETIDKQEQLVEGLEELIAQLSQQTDIRANATQIYAEQAEKREKKRWGVFLAVVTSVLIGILILGFETWERQYDRVTGLEKSIIRVEEQAAAMRKHMVKDYEFREKLNEIHKMRAKEREEALEKLEKGLRKEIDKLNKRKK